MERPGFIGAYRRSPIDDNLNTMYYSSTDKFWKTMLSFLICIIFILFYMATIFGLFFLSKFLYENFPDGMESIMLPVLVPAIINVVVF